MNFNHYCFLDYETTSKYKYTTQPVQLAAVIIDGRKLEILDKFASLIKPLSDEESVKAGLDPLTDESIAIHHKTREMLDKAPELKIVWSSFVDFVGRYNPKKDMWKAPIFASFNGTNFDAEIVRRCCEKYGPYDKEYKAQKLFHPFTKFDIMEDVFRWTENMQDIKSISMDSVRTWLGMKKDNAHDALQDCIDGSEILIKFLKLYRHYSPKTKFANAFGNKDDN